MLKDRLFKLLCENLANISIRKKLAKLPYNEFIKQGSKAGVVQWHGYHGKYKKPDANKTSDNSVHMGTKEAAIQRGLKHTFASGDDEELDDYFYGDKQHKNIKNLEDIRYRGANSRTFITRTGRAKMRLKALLAHKVRKSQVADFTKSDNRKYNPHKDLDGDMLANKFISNKNKRKPAKRIQLVKYTNNVEDEGSPSYAVMNNNNFSTYTDNVKRFGNLNKSMKTGKLTKAGEYNSQIQNLRRFKFENAIISVFRKSFINS